MKIDSIPPFSPILHPREKLGQSLHAAAFSCIKPIDYVVESSIRTFSTAIIPGQFGNQSSYTGELLYRIMQVSLGVLSLPLTLSLYGIGEALDLAGDLLQQRSYDYLQGKALELQTSKDTYTVFSANLCMLPYGIATLAGIRPSSQRIQEASFAIKQANADFVCLQEMAPDSALQLWDEIKDTYAHGFTRIGPMPASRMGGSLFFACKYPIEQTLYHPLPDTGPITRAAFCVKTEKGWIINTHLSTGSSEESIFLRKKQVDSIIQLCKRLSNQGSSPCFLFMDSNIKRTGVIDEYSSSGLQDHFISGLQQTSPFTLSANNATCTNCLSSTIKGKEDPQDIKDAFEHIDYALSYKGVAEISSSLIPAYELERREKALSDHHILLSKLS